MIERDRSRPIQSQRDIVEVPRGDTDHEHTTVLEMIECPICERHPSLGRLVDAEQRKHFKVEPLPFDHPARKTGQLASGARGDRTMTRGSRQA